MSASIGDAMALASIFHLVFMKRVLSGLTPVQQGSPLSSRERQCLQLADHGMTSLDIGEKLGITERTANYHFSNILSKLGVLNRNEAIAKGMCHGLITRRRQHYADGRGALRPRSAMPSFKRWEALRNSRRDPPSRLARAPLAHRFSRNLRFSRLPHGCAAKRCGQPCAPSHTRSAATDSTTASGACAASAAIGCAP